MQVGAPNEYFLPSFARMNKERRLWKETISLVVRTSKDSSAFLKASTTKLYRLENGTPCPFQTISYILFLDLRKCRMQISDVLFGNLDDALL
ncbi:unnamed protein product [Amaranthus hypochondriacus]